MCVCCIVDVVVWLTKDMLAFFVALSLLLRFVVLFSRLEEEDRESSYK